MMDVPIAYNKFNTQIKNIMRNKNVFYENFMLNLKPTQCINLSTVKNYCNASPSKQAIFPSDVLRTSSLLGIALAALPSVLR